MGCKTSTTDPWGNTIHYHYDAFQRLTQVLYPEVLDENGQVIRPTFSYAYDIFNNVTQIIDPKGYVIIKCYNLRGDPTRISYPDGSYELFKYDLESSLHRSFGELGLTKLSYKDIMLRADTVEIIDGNLIFKRDDDTIVFCILTGFVSMQLVVNMVLP